MIPGIDPDNPVRTDPEIFVRDDGLPCSEDLKTLRDAFALSIRECERFPTTVLGLNSSSVNIRGGLSALGINDLEPASDRAGVELPDPAQMTSEPAKTRLTRLQPKRVALLCLLAVLPALVCVGLFVDGQHVIVRVKDVQAAVALAEVYDTRIRT